MARCAIVNSFSSPSRFAVLGRPKQSAKGHLHLFTVSQSVVSVELRRLLQQQSAHQKTNVDNTVLVRWLHLLQLICKSRRISDLFLWSSPTTVNNDVSISHHCSESQRCTVFTLTNMSMGLTNHLFHIRATLRCSIASSILDLDSLIQIHALLERMNLPLLTYAG